VAAGRSGWLGGLEADLLADEDDVDAAGQLLVDLQDLPDLAVLPVLVITGEPSGMRASTAWRAASRAPATSTLNPCSSSATTVACRVFSSGSVVKRSGMAVVLTTGPP
jgi:hypothetical protein